MNTCATRNCLSNIPVLLPNYAPDGKLAYIENVCRNLIESRFGPGFCFEEFEFGRENPLPLMSGGCDRNSNLPLLGSGCDRRDDLSIYNGGYDRNDDLSLFGGGCDRNNNLPLFSGALARRTHHRPHDAGKPAAELRWHIHQAEKPAARGSPFYLV